jgi:hypothetical protein
MFKFANCGCTKHGSAGGGQGPGPDHTLTSADSALSTGYSTCRYSLGLHGDDSIMDVKHTQTHAMWCQWWWNPLVADG